MGRRTKKELERAERVIKGFLEDTQNNPHRAWDEYIKFYLESGISLPTCVKGIKDFIKTSEKFKNEYEYKIKLEEIRIENKKLEKDYQEILKNMNDDNYKIVKESYYNSKNQEHKMALCNLMMAIKDHDKANFNKNWKFNANEIRIFKELNII